MTVFRYLLVGLLLALAGCEYSCTESTVDYHGTPLWLTGNTAGGTDEPCICYGPYCIL